MRHEAGERGPGVITGPTFGITDLGWGDIGLALFLSVFAMIIVTHGKKRSGGHVLDAGWAGALAVLLMTLPVAFARKRPLVVAGVLVAGALVNWWAIGTYVRCGATLPAVFYMAFVVGSRCEGRDRVIGEALVIASILMQCESDPQISPSPTPSCSSRSRSPSWVPGYLLHRRNVTVEALRIRTMELREQRERNANLAVEADRARIADDLDQYLHGQVQDIAAAAAAGRQSLDDGPEQASDAFVAIQGTGRETLTHMREVVGSLRTEAPTGPQPVLAQLDRLLGESDGVDVRLQVTGDPRLLPAGSGAGGLPHRGAPAQHLGEGPFRRRQRRGGVRRGRARAQGGRTERPRERRPAGAGRGDRAGSTLRRDGALLRPRRAARDPGADPVDGGRGLGSGPTGAVLPPVGRPAVGRRPRRRRRQCVGGGRATGGPSRFALRRSVSAPWWPCAAGTRSPSRCSAGLLIAIPELAGDAATVNANATFVSGWAAVFLYSYALGADAPFPLSLVGIAALLVGSNLSDGGWNPVPEMLALGPYAAGLAVASRRRASAELEVRARELEEEREIFAEQSVRYERARIARELHDIVAHSVSLMVVQANAGERLAAVDPASAAEAFASISEAARQAEAEIDRLVELLNDPVPASSAGLRIVEELVARAQASGLAITCQLRGDIDDLGGGAPTPPTAWSKRASPTP